MPGSDAFVNSTTVFGRDLLASLTPGDVLTLNNTGGVALVLNGASVVIQRVA